MQKFVLMNLPFLIRWKDKPVALSIVQARLVGLAHFTIGYIFTYAPFLILLKFLHVFWNID